MQKSIIKLKKILKNLKIICFIINKSNFIYLHFT